MNEPDLRVLFTYRLLVQVGYLDDDVAPHGETWASGNARRIAVEEDHCIGCYACRDVCPASAVRVWDGLAHITNPLACDTCDGVPCIRECPTDALTDRNAGAPRFG